MRLFSDLGTPYGFTHMNGWTGHSYRFASFVTSQSRSHAEGMCRWIKEDGSWVYVKLYAESMQGVRQRDLR